MLPSRAALPLLLCLSALAWSGPGHAEAAPDQPAADAKALRDQAAEMRRRADATEESETAACYARFLVNACIDDAKAKRIQTITAARKLEAQARKIERAQREAAARARADERHDAPAAQPLSIPPVKKAPPAPSAAERAKASAEQAAKDQDKAAQRAKDEAAAAKRAAEAEADRKAYDERLRQYQQKQEQKKQQQPPQ